MTAPRIDSLLRRAGRSLLWAEVAGLLFKTVSVVIAAGMLGVIFDAVFAFGRVGLVGLDGVLLAVVVAAVWPILKRLRRGRVGADQAALIVEDRLGIADNRLVNAVDLAGRDIAGTSAALRNEVIARGEAIAGAVDAVDVIDRDALRRAIKSSAAAVVLLVLAYLVMSGVFHAVVPRLFAPLADYPAYTSVRFGVRIDPEPVYAEDPATIRVVLTGPRLPERAGVVFVDNGIASAALPMDRASAAGNGRADAQTPRTRAVYFGFHIDRVSESRRFYILTPRGRSGLYRLTADRSPRIRGADVTLNYPDYTGRPDVVGPLTSDDIGALTGTDVTLRVASNVALGGGVLRLVPGPYDGAPPGRTVPLTPDPIDPRIAQARFKLDLTGRFEVSLIGADGQRGGETLGGALRAWPDRAPSVEIVQPDREVVAPEGWRVDAQVTAGDDVGVDRVTMRYGVDAKPATTTPLALTYSEDSGKAVASAAMSLDLDALGAGAGDVVRYFAEVKDNRPRGPQVSKTRDYLIHVVSMQRYLDLARSRGGADEQAGETGGFRRRLTGSGARRAGAPARLSKQRDQKETGGTVPGDRRGEVAGPGGPVPDTFGGDVEKEGVDESEGAGGKEGERERVFDELAGLAMVGPTVPGATDSKGFTGYTGSLDASGAPGGEHPAGRGHGGLSGQVAVGHAGRAGAGPAELIQTDFTDPTGRGGLGGPGVPPEYRDQAEAYFKRMAEESR